MKRYISKFKKGQLVCSKDYNFLVVDMYAEKDVKFIKVLIVSEKGSGILTLTLPLFIDIV